MQYEFVVEVDKTAREKRQTLVGQIGFALSCGGIRVTNGYYRVTIERLKKAPVEEPDEPTKD